MTFVTHAVAEFELPNALTKSGPGVGFNEKDQQILAIAQSSSAGVRRLTPTECERLQGLPDGWTLPGADSRRYAGLGDAVTASVAHWIGERLAAQETKP